MSAWRGVARAASKPKRAMSTRAPMCDIHSIAQQASPKDSGELRVADRPVGGLVHRGGQDALLDVLLELLVLEVAAQHVARAQLARAELAVAAPAPSRLRFISIRALLAARRTRTRSSAAR